MVNEIVNESYKTCNINHIQPQKIIILKAMYKDMVKGIDIIALQEEPSQQQMYVY